MSKTKNVPTTRTPQICNNFSGNPGDPVDWQGVPGNGCTISVGTTTWPFSAGPPITLPHPSTITIKSPLAAGTYNFTVQCCASETPKTVTVS